jgi:hypothetical protein
MEQTDCHGRHQTEQTDCHRRHQTDCHGRQQKQIVMEDNKRQIITEDHNNRQIHLHNMKQIVHRQESSWATLRCIKFLEDVQSDSRMSGSDHKIVTNERVKS